MSSEFYRPAYSRIPVRTAYRHPGAGLDQFGELGAARTHVPSVGRESLIANPTC